MLSDFSTHVNQTVTIQSNPAPGFILSAIPALFFPEACGCSSRGGDEDNYVCLECEIAMMAEPAGLEPYPEELRRLEDAELVRFRVAA